MEKTKAKFASRLEEVWESKVKINAEELEKIIDVAYETRSRWTLCIVGESGIGKSMIPEAYAEKKGIGFINLKGSGLLPEDIRGFGTITKTVDRSIVTDTYISASPDQALAKAVAAYVTTPTEYVFHLIPTLAQAFTPGWKGILFLDEFAQASREVQDVYFQLIYDRRIDEKVLSDDVIVMTAMNPPGVEEYGLNPLTKAAEDRLEFYIYQPTYLEWCRWAESYGILPEIISYVRNTPSCFEDNKGRRLHNLSDRLSVMKEHGLDSHRFLLASATACLAGGHAASFVKFMSGISIRPLDILGFSDSIEESMAKIKSLSDEKRVAMVSNINKELVAILSNKTETLSIVRSALGSAKKADGTRVVRPSSKYASEFVNVRDSLTETSNDDDVTMFVAKTIMYYSLELFDKNGDIIVKFVRDISSCTWLEMKSALNTLMKKPDYSSLVKEVIRCQTSQKSKSAQA